MLEREREIHENIFLERTNKSFSLFFFWKNILEIRFVCFIFLFKYIFTFILLVGINDLH